MYADSRKKNLKLRSSSSEEERISDGNFRLQTERNGDKQIHSDYVLTWSGVDTALKAIHGVGFILHHTA